MTEPAPAPRTHGVHHVAIQVHDLAAMERFYGGVLDWEFEHMDSGEAPD